MQDQTCSLSSDSLLPSSKTKRSNKWVVEHLPSVLVIGLLTTAKSGISLEQFEGQFRKKKYQKLWVVVDESRHKVPQMVY